MYALNQAAEIEDIILIYCTLELISRIIVHDKCKIGGVSSDQSEASEQLARKPT